MFSKYFLQSNKTKGNFIFIYTQPAKAAICLPRRGIFWVSRFSASKNPQKSHLRTNRSPATIHKKGTIIPEVESMVDFYSSDFL